ncbi:DNA repair protein RecO [Candidatus Uhrbacteria bacterium]|nr:DNA repair protein RecO [Candidatus Uhrbacteria bacterium]
MSLLYQTKAIVLGRRDHKEADRWYCVFTPDKGKVEFVARGGHKPLAKLTPHLEMVAIVDLLLVHGYVYQIVAGVDRCKAFPSIYTQLPKLVLAQNALHLVDIGTRPQESDPHIYELLESWLEFLNTETFFSPERAGFLLGGFALKLLSFVGYRPELNHCLGCRRAIESNQYQWHGLKGGVVCLACTRLDSQQWFSARPITDEVLKLVRFGIEEPFDSSLRLHLSAADLLGFHETVESLMISHFPTIPASSLREACTIC